MKRIDCKKLTLNDFNKYGQFSDFTNPEGVNIVGDSADFYRDIIQTGYYENASFSVCRLKKSEMIIKGAEYHTACGEVILPMDGDIIIPLSPAVPNNDLSSGEFEAFYVPKGTLLFLKKGVRHGVSFPIDKDTVNLLICLPERTYANDCVVSDFAENDFIEVIK